MDRPARRLHFSLRQRLAKLQSRSQASRKLAGKEKPKAGRSQTVVFGALVSSRVEATSYKEG